MSYKQLGKEHIQIEATVMVVIIMKSIKIRQLHTKKND